MTNREKLIELIHHCTSCEECHDSNIADHLLANGVTVNNWRDAKTDPPPQGEDVLLCFCNGTMVVGGLLEDGDWYANSDAEWYKECKTVPEKWQPLPEPPKEGS